MAMGHSARAERCEVLAVSKNNFNAGAPSPAGLCCLVFLPIPARQRVFAHRTLQLRQVQKRFSGLPFSSRPST